MTQAKKIINVENEFFLPVNHAREFLKSVQNEALFSQLFASTLSSYFGSAKLFFKNFLNEIIKGVFLIQSADPHNVFWILTFYLRSTGGTISHMFVLILIFNTVGERTGSTLDHNIASSKHTGCTKAKLDTLNSLCGLNFEFRIK